MALFQFLITARFIRANLLMPFLFLRQESIITQQSCLNPSWSTEIISTQFPKFLAFFLCEVEVCSQLLWHSTLPVWKREKNCCTRCTAKFFSEVDLDWSVKIVESLLMVNSWVTGCSQAVCVLWLRCIMVVKRKASHLHPVAVEWTSLAAAR